MEEVKTSRQAVSQKIIFLLFFASGISGLIYEVVYLRILSRTIGVTAYATAVTLAAFMAGLALGSFIFGRLVDKRDDQLRIFALLQIWLAVFAIITPFILIGSTDVYKFVSIMTHQSTTAISLSKVIVSFLSLLVPTVLMGGTLPALTSYLVRQGGMFGENFSLLYGLNTLGAVLGVVLSGFITIGAIGEWNTIFIGATINLVVGFVTFVVYRRKLRFTGQTGVTHNVAARTVDNRISVYSDTVRKMVLIAFMISGFTALAYEVVWTRQLILFLQTSIYAFSGMLAIFLVGVAIGSMFMNRYVDRLRTPLLIFGILELAIGALSIFNLYLFGSLDSTILTRVLSPVVLVLPLTLLFGAIFPIASLCYAKSTDLTGTSVGILYTFNAVGNVAGSLFTGFLFISLLGSSKTVIILGFVNIMLGLVLLWLEPRTSRGYKLKFLLIVPAAVLLTLGFKGRDPFLTVIENRIAKDAKYYEIYHNRETVEGTVTSFVRDGFKHLWINGYGQTTLCTETKLMAHLPVMLADKPKEMLVMCFGMGTTARSACIYDDLNITCVELVPEVYKCFGYYHSDAQKVISRPNVRFIANDGRNFLLLSPDKYDVIIVDPSPPVYNAGTVNLYTREFFTLCREHLTPGGVMCLWFPGSSQQDNLNICKTFYSVFKNMTLWKSLHNNNRGFYLLGTSAPTNIDRSKIEHAFTNPRLVKDLSEIDKVGITSEQLLNLFLMRDGKSLDELTETASIITDNHPYTEFPLWRYLLSRESDRIH
ncbi:MAG: fused MFS/spermidine synthase [Sedimentisphaerales bacterium]|jgi:spermidine synthase